MQKADAMTDPDRERLEACREWLYQHGLAPVGLVLNEDAELLTDFVRQREEKQLLHARAEQREEDRRLAVEALRHNVKPKLPYRVGEGYAECVEAIERALPPLKLEP